MFSGSNVVINQLLKSIWKVDHLEKSILYMLREKKSIQQKMTKIGTFENKAQIWSFKRPYIFGH
jgi:hypothetical protein